MSFYRKHRPQQFMDLVGQDHIKTTLANALKTDSFSHAYIFAGPKGSGKTTTARLLAKALNCTGRKLTDDFEPCDKCTSCLEVTGGHSMDVMEIDAASNRGIDEIRDLREKINFAPSAGRYKVYVIDECHMLTKEAFNALLKTLEEPPAHAVFILATTELHKVPATILSRAQLFDFKKARVDEVLGLLETIVKKEGIKIEPEALQLIARLAYGAYRDGLTLLDQISSIKTEGKITLAQVQAVLGQATEQSVWDLVDALSLRDRTQALKVVNDVYFEGKDLSNFVSGVIELLRKVILIQVGLPEHFEASAEEKVKIETFGQRFESSDLMILIQKLSEVLPQVKSSVLGQLPLEMVVFAMTKEKEQESKKQDTNEIKKDTGDKIQDTKGEDTIHSTSSGQGKQDTNEGETKEEVINIEVEEKVTEPEKIVEPEVKVVAMVEGGVSQAWPALIKEIKIYNNSIAAMLRDAVINSEDDDNIVLRVKFKFQADQLSNPKIRPVIEEAMTKVCGKNLRLECLVDTKIEVIKPVEREEELLSEAKEIFAT